MAKMKTVSYQPDVMRIHSGGKSMRNMNKKRWIFVGIGILTVFVLIVFLNTESMGEHVFLELGESSQLFGDAEKAVSLERTETSEPSGFPEKADVSEQQGNAGMETSPSDTARDVEVVVYVCGAVKKPGVYQCRQGERVSHAVERAGGLKKNASEVVNLAEPLVDGQRVYIPTRKETAGKTPQAEELPDGRKNAEISDSEVQRDSKVNINTADAAVLMTLPGIGESRAQSILDYRKEHGSFQSIEEIKNISGIKERLFSQIQELITVQ